MSDTPTNVVRLVLGAICSERSARTFEDVAATSGLSGIEVDQGIDELVRRDFLASALEPLVVTDEGRDWWNTPDATTWEISLLTLVRDNPGHAGTWYGGQLGWTKDTHRGRWQKLSRNGLLAKNGTGSASRWHLTANGHAVINRHRQQTEAERVAKGPFDGFHASEATADECRETVIAWLCLQDDAWTDEGPLAAWMTQHGWLTSSVSMDLGELVRRGRIELRLCGARRWYREAGRGDLGEVLLQTVQEVKALREDLQTHHDAMFA